jgi:hypothetical protein
LFFSPSERQDFEPCSTNAAAQLLVGGEPAERASQSLSLRHFNPFSERFADTDVNLRAFRAGSDVE